LKLRTSATALALAYAALIVYASLYPFENWRDQGVEPWAFVSAAWPRYWTWFDVISNVLGYAPLGFLMVLSRLRRKRARWAVLLCTLLAALLSFGLEAVQTYLPDRRASNVDWALNSLGAFAGALSAWGLKRGGVLDRWSRFRAEWFSANAQSALVLLALWPVALLFPASEPLGLGQVYERAEQWLAEQLIGTPFLEWLPVREVELQPLLPLAQLGSVAIGLLVPCLLAFAVMQRASQRVVWAFVTTGVAVMVTALSAALSYGPEHAWAWLQAAPVRYGLGVGFVLALMLVRLPRRASWALLALLSVAGLVLLNQAPIGPYFDQTLQIWEQGRFIRFYGVVQWLGWLWPFAVLALALRRLFARRPDDAADEADSTQSANLK
jgi:VanZ family protein